MRPSPPSSTRALEEARARLDESLAKNPSDPALLLMRGRADERLEQFEDAAKFFQRAAKLLHEQGDRPAEAAASASASSRCQSRATPIRSTRSVPRTRSNASNVGYCGPVPVQSCWNWKAVGLPGAATSTVAVPRAGISVTRPPAAMRR